MPIFSSWNRRLSIIGFALIITAAAPSCNSPAQVAPESGRVAEAISQDAEAETLDGRVVGIADGDTITVLTGDREEVRVRLANVDAPERGQPWSARSKQVLSGIIFGREVRVRQSGVDRWGRVIGHVSFEGRDVSREMVARGAAWAFRRYLTDPSLVEVEERAKRGKVGLWALPEAETIPPWEWRRGARVVEPASTDSTLRQTPQRNELSASGEFACGTKTRCSQMASCAEAEFYLRQCRLTTLDGNRDGEPCEQLCGTVSRPRPRGPDAGGL